MFSGLAIQHYRMVQRYNKGHRPGLDDTLKVTNDFYSEELNIKIDKAMKLAEPMITVIIGLVIGLFIIAMVIPMFDAINSI